MRNLTRAAAMGVGLMVLLPLSRVSAGEKQYKDKYQNIEVMRFVVKEGIEFPPDYLVTMMEELVTQLKETKKFQEVLREGEKPDNAEAPTLRLTGTVTEYRKGSRAKRYLVGFGAGKTKIVAHIQFSDPAVGVLYEDDVDGKVVMGGMGGESVGATRGLAKEVAKVTKQQFF